MYILDKIAISFGNERKKNALITHFKLSRLIFIQDY